MIKRIIAAVFICFLVYAQVTSIPSSAGGGAGDVTGSGNLTTPGAMVVVSSSGVVKEISGGLCEPYYSSSTVIGIRACSFGIGNYPETNLAACVTAATPSSSGTLYVYIQDDGVPILGYSGSNTTGCTGWTVEQNVTGFPDLAYPIGTFTWAASAWSSTVVDNRRFIRRDVYRFGTGLTAVTTLGGIDVTNDFSPAVGQAGTVWKVADTSSSTTTYTGCPTSTLGALSTGMFVWFKAANANTASSTLNLCGLGAVTLQKIVGVTLTNLAANDLSSAAYTLFSYNGTVFVKMGNPLVFTGSATINFGSVATGACSADSSITVTGATINDGVVIQAPATVVAAGVMFFGYIANPDTIGIRFCNFSGVAVDPDSETYLAFVIHP